MRVPSRLALLTLCVVVGPALAGGASDEQRMPDGRPAAAAALTEPGIVIHSVRTELREDVYYLDAGIEYRLGKTLEEALLKGVALPIVVNVEVIRERTYLWNETAASLEQRYTLELHALTRQYIIRNENIGTQTAYTSLDEAIAALGRIDDLPVIDANLLSPGEQYLGRLQARIEVDALPVPLRLLSIVSPEWRLSSEWREWRF